MYYTVTLLNNSLDKSSADLVLYQNANTYQIAVLSRNKKMQTHLEKLVSSQYHVISPGKLQPREATVCALDVQPYTMEFFELVPEILGWRGYKAEFHNEVYKSFDLVSDFFVLKSTDIYNNAKGERIVKHVPQGYIAVHNDGRVVAGGKFLNANIDKEGAEWTLQLNPHEGQTPQDRDNAKADWEIGVDSYHPGFDNELYNKRTEDVDEGEYYTVQDEFKPEGKTLAEQYGKLPVEQIEEILQHDKVSLPAHLPPKLAEDTLVYSPDYNVAFNSAYWPPVGLSDFENATWYAFDYPEIGEEDYDSMIEVLGMSPQFIKGTRQGIVRLDESYDTEEGVLINLGDSIDSVYSGQDDNLTIIVNKPAKEEFNLDDYHSESLGVSIARARELVSRWKDLTAYKQEDGTVGVSPQAANIKLPELRGLKANFSATPYPYQNPVIKALTEPSQYEVFGGPRGSFGHYLNLTYGAGKTPIVLAAEAIWRNQGRLATGTQVTIITAPSKNIHVWGDEIQKFRNEQAVIIDGHKQDRIRQWEGLLELARKGELPNFVVVSGSKFRLGNEVADEEDDEEKKELGLDAKYMKLMSLGGKSQGKNVKGGHVGLMVLDETGNYVNPKSSRFAAVSEISESVYYGNGVVWTLNGDLSGNSANDTISEVSFINMYAKDNYSELSKRYTKPDPNRPHSDAKVWRTKGELPEFMARYKAQIYSLDGKTIAGDEYGLKYTDDLQTPLGRNWGRVYTDALEKMEATSSLGRAKAGRALGMLGILIGSSYGAVQPQRLLEYDIGTDILLKDVQNLMDAQSYSDFREELRNFLKATTEETIEVGRLPIERMQTQKRDEAYTRAFSQSSRNTLEKVMEMWDNPALEDIIKGIDDAIKSSKGQPIKLGVAGFSKRAIQSLHRRLTNEYDETSVTVLKFDGDTDSSDISTQQLTHQNEKDKHVISLVTGAGLYGLSLAADRSWVFSTWNPAKLGQYGGRFHRNPRQANVLTIVVPSGAPEYIRVVERRKKEIQEYAKSELLEIDVKDDGEEVEANLQSMSKLIDKLMYFYPKILTEESRLQK